MDEKELAKKSITICERGAYPPVAWSLAVARALLSQPPSAAPEGMPEEPPHVSALRKRHDLREIGSEIFSYIDALRAYALSQQEKREGMVMVPKEPTAEMIIEGFHAYSSTEHGSIKDGLVALYKAMVAAAPPAGKERG